MFGAFYPGWAYPGQSPDYPAVLYTPTYHYRAVVPVEVRAIAVPHERRSVAVPYERPASVRERRVAVVPRESRTSPTEF